MSRRFEIVFAEGVKADLRKFRAYDRQAILDAIETHLTEAPSMETRARKLLRHLIPPFEAVPPIWQLRIGAFRVFYDVDEAERRVYVRAIRHKPPHRQTQEIL